MVELKLVLADDDLGYINAITKFLSSWHVQEFRIISFTDKELLADYLQREQCNILLISPEWMKNEGVSPNVQVTVLLNASNRLPETLKDYPSINKYQTGDVLGKQLIRLFSEYSQDEVIISDISGSTQITGIYSPVGGSGKTSVAIGMARLLARSGQSILLLSLEDLASYGYVLDTKATNEFSDLLYFVKQNHKNLMLKIEGLKSVDEESGLTFFSPVSCYQDMQEMTTDEWIHLISYLQKYASYDRIVIDFDTSLGSRNMKLLTMCDDIALIANNHPISIYKFEKLIHDFNQMNVSLLQDKGSLLINDVMDNGPLDYETIGDLPIAGYIPYDRGLYKEGVRELNVQGGFGHAIENYMGLESVEVRDIHE